MKKILLLAPLSIFLFFTASAQIGGQYVYSFLKQTPSARLTGLNGSQIVLKDDDISIGFVNPAMLNPLIHNVLSFNQDFLLGGIRTGYFGYGYNVDKYKTTFQAGIQYAAYGTFQRTDEFGNNNGEFKANEYALAIGAGHQINERFSVGLNVKYITSQLEAYRSTGLVADLAGAYWYDEKKVGVTVVFKNMGAQLANYNGRRENVPLDVQIGFTKKLNRAPLRFSAVLHDLNRWNIRYDSPLENDVTLLGEAPAPPSAFSLQVDNFFRHLNVGGELIFGKNENVCLRIGYSHQVRKELNINSIRSLAGFSFGIGFKVSYFRIDYGFGRQHIAGGMNHLGISTNFESFRKK